MAYEEWIVFATLVVVWIVGFVMGHTVRQIQEAVREHKRRKAGRDGKAGQ